MAKKARADSKKKVKAAPKAVPTAKTAKRMGRATGNALAKKPASVKRGKKKQQNDPEVKATQAQNRALWKSQEREATSIELAKHGALVDERARVRSLTGISWSNRKPH
jgi:hypothetical protein